MRRAGRINGYPERADSAVFVGVMIENVRAMENIDDLLQVPGLGFVRMGSGDMAVSLGHPIVRSAPAVAERREALMRACNRHGVPVCGNEEAASEVQFLVDNGYSILTFGKDLEILRSVLNERVGAIQARDLDGGIVT